ncbi:MAG: hypothetical protein WCV62_00485 [Candidatus Peribacteraceae bacterium]|jgi:hypothetical protein
MTLGLLFLSSSITTGMAAAPLGMSVHAGPASLRTWELSLFALLVQRPQALLRPSTQLLAQAGETTDRDARAFPPTEFGRDWDVFASDPAPQPTYAALPGVNQEVLAPSYPASGDGMPRTPAAPAGALHEIVQATENNYAWYGPYIDFDAVSNTVVNAVQNITNNNTVTVIQNCGSNCTQNAAASAHAATDASQAINALSQNNAALLQVGAQTGSGSAAPGASVGANADTVVNATVNALTQNLTSIEQNAADAGGSPQTADVVADAAADVTSRINAGSLNTSVILQQ